MTSFPLNVLPLPVQRYSCHGCGDCCRDFTVQLTAEDEARLAAQAWEAVIGEPVTVRFRGGVFLRQREDGACVFLQPDGLCRIHAALGFEAKPLACQVFPFSLAPGTEGTVAGINFACRSVQENRGAALPTHAADLRRFQAAVPAAQRPVGVALAGGMEARRDEVETLAATMDRWLTRRDESWTDRMDGLAWLAQQLMAARLESVRGPRFRELLDLLVSVLPGELHLAPVAAPSRRQSSLLRQAVFARTEDPRIPRMARTGRLVTVLGQLMRSRRFARGKGLIPPVGRTWPAGATFEARAATSPLAASPEAPAIDDLLTRWLRATILGGRAWGSGFYGWPMVDGVAALALNAVAVAWLTRARAAAEGRRTVSLEDARAAVGRIDRTAGRAPWLAGAAERLRLEYLADGDGLRRLMAAELVGPPGASPAAG